MRSTSRSERRSGGLATTGAHPQRASRAPDEARPLIARRSALGSRDCRTWCLSWWACVAAVRLRWARRLWLAASSAAGRRRRPSAISPCARIGCRVEGAADLAHGRDGEAVSSGAGAGAQGGRLDRGGFAAAAIGWVWVLVWVHGGIGWGRSRRVAPGPSVGVRRWSAIACGRCAGGGVRRCSRARPRVRRSWRRRRGRPSPSPVRRSPARVRRGSG